MRVKFVKKEQVAQNTWTFFFKPEKKLRYIAGQFIELSLPVKNSDPNIQKHWFTLSSAPNQDLISITTKSTTNQSSFKRTLLELRTGQELDMSQAMGDFVLPKNPDIPVVFIAGGIGCTPFASIISDLKNKGEKRDIVFYYSAKSKDHVLFEEIFSYLGKNYHKIIDNRIDIKNITKAVNSNPKTHFYISGPEPLVESFLSELLSFGVNRSKISTDFFPGYTEV